MASTENVQSGRSGSDFIGAREALECELLDLIERHPEMSQRQLADVLGVSVGRLNYCLRAVADRGWVKTRRFARSDHKHRYLYVLTPVGMKQRAALLGSLLKRKLAEYDRLKEEIARIEGAIDGHSD